LEGFLDDADRRTARRPADLPVHPAAGQDVARHLRVAVAGHGAIPPGYALVRGLAERVAGEGEGTFQPALVEVEDALSPGFIIEELEDGRCVPTGLALRS